VHVNRSWPVHGPGHPLVPKYGPETDVQNLAADTVQACSVARSQSQGLLGRALGQDSWRISV
jgi:hypothetical protein